jgi:tetratricopeptide (TPR) repeat protein
MSILSLPNEISDIYKNNPKLAPIIIILLILVSVILYSHQKNIQNTIRKLLKPIIFVLIVGLIIFSIPVVLDITKQYPESQSFRIVISPFQIVESSSKQNDFDFGTPESIKNEIEKKQKNIEVIILPEDDAVINLEKAKSISEKYNAHIVLFGKTKDAYLGEKKSVDCSVYISEKIKNRDTIQYRDNLQSSIAGLFDYRIQSSQDVSNFEGQINDVVNLILGLENYFSNNYSGSLIYLTNVSQKSLNSDTYVYIGNAQQSLNLINDSFESINKSLKLDPNNFYAWGALGLLDQKIGKYNESLSSLNKSIMLNPDNPQVWLDGGVSFQSLGNYDSALKYYSEPLKKYPNYYPSLVNVGQIEILKGNLTEAEIYTNRAIEVDPTYEHAWVNKGEIYRLKGDFNTSLVYIDKALSINQNDPEAWVLRGQLLDKLERPDEAIKSYDKAIEINPNFEIAWYKKGISYFYIQKYNEAITSFKKVIEINPANYNAQIYLGQTFGELMEWDMAKQAFIRAMEIDPSKEIAQKNLDTLLLRQKYSYNSSQSVIPTVVR